jgi:hypothetical protein
MDYITDYTRNIRIVDDLIYKTHIYIVNNLYRNYTNPEDYINDNYDNIYDDIYDDDELTSLQYFNIMSFLDEIE